MDADGTNRTRLTDNTRAHTDLAPDGKKIVFDSSPYLDDIYVMNADGSGVTKLTHNPAYDIYPDWSPDGKRIMFIRQSGDAAGNVAPTQATSYQRIYVMHVEVAD
jgi:Tol biopolymer transport system component